MYKRQAHRHTSGHERRSHMIFASLYSLSNTCGTSNFLPFFLSILLDIILSITIDIICHEKETGKNAVFFVLHGLRRQGNMAEFASIGKYQPSVTARSVSPFKSNVPFLPSAETVYPPLKPEKETYPSPSVVSRSWVSQSPWISFCRAK